MSLTGTYVWTDGRMVKVSDKPLNVRAADATDLAAKPFKEKVMEGYRRQEAAGNFKSGWKPETIKRTWNN